MKPATYGRHPGEITALDQHHLRASLPYWSQVPAPVLQRLERLRTDRWQEAKRLARNQAYDEEMRRRQDRMTKIIERDYLQGELSRIAGHDPAHGRVSAIVNQLTAQLNA
jgi:hypothetical protein